jgi:hypothetical protein
MFGTLLQSALTIKIPLWSALILAVSLAYVTNRPTVERVETKIEYRTYWKPPIIKQTLPPSRIVNYAHIPKQQTRVDTVRVPIQLTSYQLWQPEQVQSARNSVVIRSFDPTLMIYRDYTFKPLQPKFDASIEAYALYPARIGLDATAWYRNVGLVGRIEQGESLYYGVGLKYRF